MLPGDGFDVRANKAGVDLTDGSGTTPPPEWIRDQDGPRGSMGGCEGPHWMFQHYNDGRRGEGLAWIAECRLEWRSNR